MASRLPRAKEEESALRVVRDRSVLVEWDIPRFFTLPHTFNKSLESPSFSFSGTEWTLQILPNCIARVFLYLQLKRFTEAFPVLFTIGIKNGKDSVWKSFCGNKRFLRAGDYWGSPAIPRLELIECRDSAFPDSVLTIFLTAVVLNRDPILGAAEAACQTPCDGFHTLSRDFKQLFLDGDEGDIVFQVKGKKFPAHKLVLSIRCTVFRAMLEADMLEKNKGTIDILDADPDDFERFLIYLYSGELDIVSSGRALGLYMLADKYKLMELKKACSQCLAREISVDSFCDVTVLASLHNETDMLETVTDFFIRHAEVILSTPKWLEFNVQHVTLANELMIKMTKALKSC